jgi:uncharacterized protein YlbG (UPF0298 family)
MNGKKKKYPVLYLQVPTTSGSIHLDAYDLQHRIVYVGTEKLTDLLDELEKLRTLWEETNER